MQVFSIMRSFTLSSSRYTLAAAACVIAVAYTWLCKKTEGASISKLLKHQVPLLSVNVKAFEMNHKEPLMNLEMSQLITLNVHKSHLCAARIARVNLPVNFQAFMTWMIICPINQWIILYRNQISGFLISPDQSCLASVTCDSLNSSWNSHSVPPGACRWVCDAARSAATSPHLHIDEATTSWSQRLICEKTSKSDSGVIKHRSQAVRLQTFTETLQLR